MNTSGRLLLNIKDSVFFIIAVVVAIIVAPLENIEFLKAHKVPFGGWNRSFVKIWVYLGQGSQEWTKKNLWKTSFKNFEVIWSA